MLLWFRKKYVRQLYPLILLSIYIILHQVKIVLATYLHHHELAFYCQLGLLLQNHLIEIHSCHAPTQRGRHVATVACP